ncbi:MAG: hypothetical protein LR017_00385 [Candidatus Pacebacteria bacterium]|nr:hypothetical protein [Candidatus Paceibacterota bacterium]
MSKKEYIKALNEEIQKLNGLIDYKIIHDDDYRREARRHKKLLAQIRREEAGRMVNRLMRTLVPSWK